MKIIPIKIRVTLWYTLLMLAILAICLVFVILTGRSAVVSTTENTVKSVVNEAAAELEYDNGSLVPEDDLGYYYKSVYLYYTDLTSGESFGKLPQAFEDSAVSFKDAELQELTSGQTTWLVYDSLVTVFGYGQVQVRGVSDREGSYTALSVLVKLFIIFVPILVFITAVGGFFITAGAFRPVKRITATAKSISGGKDLSRRINLGKGRDEIFTLANTFDTMFDRLELAFQNEKQFTADASHELRTPTTVIISQCEYALEGERDKAELSAALESIQKQAKKMSALISQLLTLSRADRGNEKLSFELVNLSELFEMVSEELYDLAAEKNITVSAEFEPDLLLRGDQTMLIRMLMNLSENAVKYGRDGGSVRLTLKREQAGIVGHVIDDGIGIDAQHLPKIWERFYQADPSRSVSGNGLGLSMVKWIAEAHGGSVSVKSEPGKGSDFSFIFPSGTE